MIAREAAPHSTASICNTVGVVTRLRRSQLPRDLGAATFSGSMAVVPIGLTEAQFVLEEGEQQAHRRLVAGDHLHRAEGAAADRNRRAAGRRPVVPARGHRIALQGDSQFGHRAPAMIERTNVSFWKLRIKASELAGNSPT